MNKFLLKWPMMLMMAAMMIFTSCDDDDDDDASTSQPKTIAATVESDANFSILLDALNRTGLTSVLASTSSEFTVFAPDNDAFQALLDDGGYQDLDALETALTTDGLKNILLYHVVGAKVMASAVTTGYATTEGTNADGDKLSLYTDASSGVRINGVPVEQADISASNGVIHQIESVLMPLNIAELVSLNTSTYTNLVAALGTADGNLVATLSGSDQFTVFAPDDAAFAALLTATSSNDLSELVTFLGGTTALANVLLYHVVPGNVRAEDLDNGMVPTAFTGNSIDIALGTEVTITDGQGGMSTVKETNIQGTNGVVHRISAVLVP